MINVFLDDLRPNPKGFILTRTARETIDLLKQHDVNILSLDHDLGAGQPTGYDVVLYMVKHHLYPKHIIIHSANPIGRINMYQLLMQNKPAKVSVTIRPAFPWI